MNFPSKLVENAVDQLASLPGIGRKSALRLVLHLLKKDKITVEQFGDSFIQLINRINYCTDCYNISDKNICEICSNTKRDKKVISFFKNKSIPIATVIGGGYSDDNIELAKRHSIIFQAVDEIFN